jgi:hypothetical protein
MQSKTNISKQNEDYFLSFILECTWNTIRFILQVKVLHYSLGVSLILKRNATPFLDFESTRQLDATAPRTQDSNLISHCS